MVKYNYFHDLLSIQCQLNALKEKGYQDCQIAKTFFD